MRECARAGKARTGCVYEGGRVVSAAVRGSVSVWRLGVLALIICASMGAASVHDSVVMVIGAAAPVCGVRERKCVTALGGVL